MYRCYGSQNIAIIKSERGDKIAKIATNFKNLSVAAFICLSTY